MLPNELLLQVLHFADYRMLVAAKLASARFLRLAVKFADELVCRHSFKVIYFVNGIKYNNVTTGAQGVVRYEPGSRPSLAAACRELAGAIGPHAVVEMTFSGNTWTAPGVTVIFEAAPALKYAEDVFLHNPGGSAIGDNSEAFMSNFAAMKAIHIWLDNDVFHHFSWTFLCRASARELRHIIVFAIPLTPPENVCRSIEDLVRTCVTFPHLTGGKALEVDFSANYSSSAFGLRIIELFKGTRREAIFRMCIQPGAGELTLNEGDYAVDVDGTTRRYASEKNGIVVEVKGREITIQSTADVSRDK